MKLLKITFTVLMCDVTSEKLKRQLLCCALVDAVRRAFTGESSLEKKKDCLVVYVLF